MRKLKLNLDQLTVDSFDTAPSAAEKGTVVGEQGPCTCPTNCTCPGCPTCDHTACGQNTCGQTCYTCEWSCGGSCWYTECGGDTVYDRTCNASNGPVRECCPY